MTTMLAPSHDVRPDLVAAQPGAALHWMYSTRSRRVFLLLIAVCIINAFDLTMTLQADHDGILHEQNPIARALLAHGEIPVSLFKIGLVAAASMVLWRCRAHRCAELATVLAVLVYAVVAVQWKACYDAYDLTLAAGGDIADVAVTQRWIFAPIF